MTARRARFAGQDRFALDTPPTGETQMLRDAVRGTCYGAPDLARATGGGQGVHGLILARAGTMIAAS